VYLGTLEKCEKAYRLWWDFQRERDEHATVKSLQYITKWITQKLTERGQRDGHLPADYVEAST
jgi:hypothetical protein